MGTGTNVQKRLVALHHLDAPWKPAEVEQREGRILRQGNENKEVAVYRYVTEGSFDAYMWQALETKARFIAQVMTGESAARRVEDIGGQELSYAEVKAIASGNPAVLTLAEADAELQRLALLKKNHLDEQYVARRRVRDLPGTIASLSERLSNLTAHLARIAHRAQSKGASRVSQVECSQPLGDPRRPLLMTPCYRPHFTLAGLHRQPVAVAFDAPTIVSDTGLLTVRDLHRGLGYLADLAARLPDPRSQPFVTHTARRRRAVGRGW
jgi:hypothetical protein